MEDGISKRYRYALQQAQHTDRLDCLHVSDLIKECDRYTWYNNRLPMKPSQSLEEMKSLIWGQILHKVVRLDRNHNEYNELELFYNWKEDKIGNEEDKLLLDEPDLRYDYLAGSIDDLIEIDGQWVICDKKTTGSFKYFKNDRTNANRGHVMQTSIYAVLAKICHNIDVEFGCNIYIDNGNSDNERAIEPAIKVYRLDDFDKTYKFMIDRCKEVRSVLTTDNLPPSTENWMCYKACPHSAMCSRDENPNIINVDIERHELEDK